VRTSRPGDHEFLEADEWQGWNALLMVNRTVLQSLDAALRQAHGIAVTEFDVLITLFNAPDRRLRMTALSEHALLSPAGTTHVVTRLERDGLVRREADPSDGRKWFTVLTEKGDQVLRNARATHNAVVRESFTAMTTPAERRTMQKLWERLSEKTEVTRR
jgi:DNA-binding MarR family transcriptional regulator